MFKCQKSSLILTLIFLNETVQTETIYETHCSLLEAEKLKYCSKFSHNEKVKQLSSSL